MSELVVLGAREHNLRGVDLRLPRNKLVVFTGPSGSGKSSLAFDTIYAEAQRRYVESLSTYARRFLERLPKPEVDHIEGLSPAIAIEQRPPSRNPRSTVGTVTEVLDHLRLLYARVGVPHCPSCGDEVVAHTVQQMVDRILAEPEGTRFAIVAPVVRGVKGKHLERLSALRREGFVRVRIDGDTLDLGDEIDLDARAKHDIDVYVDRLSVKSGVAQRLAEAIELATGIADGRVRVLFRETGEWLLSERFACADCDVTLPPLEPRLFSFNGLQGACPTCMGLGEERRVDPERVIPDGARTIRDGAVVAWGKPGGAFHRAMLERLAEQYPVDVDQPWTELPPKTRTALLSGAKKKAKGAKEAYEGILPGIERRMREYERRKREGGSGEDRTIEMLEEEFGAYLRRETCRACSGRRLRPEALAVTVDGLAIDELSAMSLPMALERLSAMKLEGPKADVAAPLLREIRGRTAFLIDVGLSYLSFDRSARTLSGGEAQRIRLATQIGAGLMGVLYVLDEPSIGLHPRDNARLLETLEALRDRGNTVLVVEHDAETIRRADHIVDMGPGAGKEGGRVVAEGTLREIEANELSSTGAFLCGRRRIPTPTRRKKSKRFIRIRGAALHNLKGLDVDIPLGVMTCVTGVSGSGKSSLIVDTLAPVARERLNRAFPVDVRAKVEGLEALERLVEVDQSPIGRTPRSNPATYAGVLGGIRELYATLPEAKARGYKAGRFSFNVKGGRCEACRGEGLVRIEMHFLPDVFVTCEHCSGTRYNRETLDIRYRGMNIADVLALEVNEAAKQFEVLPRIREKLEALRRVGLGYLELGRSATTLSGGEAQRLKLARELARRGKGPSLYVLDEPTTGLHFTDVEVLVGILRELVDAGNTVVVIEHDVDVIRVADHVIDLGPEGGAGGGELVAAGTPEAVARVGASHTGRFLERALVI